MKNKVKYLSILLIFILFLGFPKTVGEGAKKGLLLWFGSVLPALLPFMIFSSVMVKMEITGMVSKLVYPFFHRLFGLSKEGGYPVVIGLLSGYPLGAKTVSDLYLQKAIGKQEAEFLLLFCNNASPMFLMQFIGIHCLSLTIPVGVLLIIILTAMGNAFIYKCFYMLTKREHEGWYFREPVSNSAVRIGKGRTGNSFIEVLDTSILESFVVLTKVGGYIIVFSILANMVEQTFFMPELLRAFITGFLEITTGGEAVRNLRIAAKWKSALLVSICAFGGCSGMAQTFSVMGQSGLSKKKYVLAKVVQAIVTFFITMAYYGV